MPLILAATPIGDPRDAARVADALIRAVEAPIELDGRRLHVSASVGIALFPHDARLVLFSVGAVTEGTDAQAKTTVRLEEAGKMVDGQGADTDTIVAATRAYVHALNKLVVKRARTEPAAMTA